MANVTTCLSVLSWKTFFNLALSQAKEIKSIQNFRHKLKRWHVHVKHYTVQLIPYETGEVLYAITVCSNSNAVSPWKLTYLVLQITAWVISFIIWMCYSHIKSPGSSNNLVLQLINISKNSFIQSFNTFLIKKKEQSAFKLGPQKITCGYNRSRYIFLHKSLHWIPYIRHNSLLDVSTVIILLL